MIIVALPSKPFTLTAKNTTRRQAVISDYNSEIEALYRAVDETAQSHIPPPPSLSYADCLPFCRAVVRHVLKRNIEDSDDIFQHGGDR